MSIPHQFLSIPDKQNTRPAFHFHLLQHDLIPQIAYAMVEPGALLLNLDEERHLDDYSDTYQIAKSLGRM
jgi:hypothetical protein